MSEIDLTSIQNIDEGDMSNPGASPSEPSEPPAEEKYGYERRKKILMLQMYLNEFPNKLKDYAGTDLESLSGDELNKIREEMDYILGTKSTVNVGVNAFLQGITALEFITNNFTPLNVSGLGQASANDEELIQDVKHICLKHMDLVKTEPEARVCFKLLQNMLILNTLNKKVVPAEEIAPDTPTRKINVREKPNNLNELNSEFNDLL